MYQFILEINEISYLLQSKISKRRLRLPALVHPAYAKVMKKLNFCG